MNTNQPKVRNGTIIHTFNGIDYDKVRLASLGNECAVVKVNKSSLIETDEVLVDASVGRPFIQVHSDDRYLIIARPPRDPDPKSDQLQCSLVSKYVLKKARYTAPVEQPAVQPRYGYDSYDGYQPRGYNRGYPPRRNYGTR